MSETTGGGPGPSEAGKQELQAARGEAAAQRRAALDRAELQRIAEEQQIAAQEQRRIAFEEADIDDAAERQALRAEQARKAAEAVYGESNLDEAAAEALTDDTIDTTTPRARFRPFKSKTPQPEVYSDAEAPGAVDPDAVRRQLQRKVEPRNAADLEVQTTMAARQAAMEASARRERAAALEQANLGIAAEDADTWEDWNAAVPPVGSTVGPATGRAARAAGRGVRTAAQVGGRNLRTAARITGNTARTAAQMGGQATRAVAMGAAAAAGEAWRLTGGQAINRLNARRTQELVPPSQAILTPQEREAVQERDEEIIAELERPLGSAKYRKIEIARGLNGVDEGPVRDDLLRHYGFDTHANEAEAHHYRYKDPRIRSRNITGSSWFGYWAAKRWTQAVYDTKGNKIRVRAFAPSRGTNDIALVITQKRKGDKSVQAVQLVRTQGPAFVAGFRGRLKMSENLSLAALVDINAPDKASITAEPLVTASRRTEASRDVFGTEQGHRQHHEDEHELQVAEATGLAEEAARQQQWNRTDGRDPSTVELSAYGPGTLNYGVPELTAEEKAQADQIRQEMATPPERIIGENVAAETWALVDGNEHAGDQIVKEADTLQQAIDAEGLSYVMSVAARIERESADVFRGYEHADRPVSPVPDNQALRDAVARGEAPAMPPVWAMRALAEARLQALADPDGLDPLIVDAKHQRALEAQWRQLADAQAGRQMAELIRNNEFALSDEDMALLAAGDVPEGGVAKAEYEDLVAHAHGGTLSAAQELRLGEIMRRIPELRQEAQDRELNKVGVLLATMYRDSRLFYNETSDDGKKILTSSYEDAQAAQVALDNMKALAESKGLFIPEGDGSDGGSASRLLGDLPVAMRQYPRPEDHKDHPLADKWLLTLEQEQRKIFSIELDVKAKAAQKLRDAIVKGEKLEVMWPIEGKLQKTTVEIPRTIAGLTDWMKQNGLLFDAPTDSVDDAQSVYPLGLAGAQSPMTYSRRIDQQQTQFTPGYVEQPDVLELRKWLEAQTAVIQSGGTVTFPEYVEPPAKEGKHKKDKKDDTEPGESEADQKTPESEQEAEVPPSGQPEPGQPEQTESRRTSNPLSGAEAATLGLNELQALTTSAERMRWLGAKVQEWKAAGYVEDAPRGKDFGLQPGKGAAGEVGAKVITWLNRNAKWFDDRNRQKKPMAKVAFKWAEDASDARRAKSEADGNGTGSRTEPERPGVPVKVEVLDVRPLNEPPLPEGPVGQPQPGMRAIEAAPVVAEDDPQKYWSNVPEAEPGPSEAPLVFDAEGKPDVISTLDTLGEIKSPIQRGVAALKLLNEARNGDWTADASDEADDLQESILEGARDFGLLDLQQRMGDRVPLLNAIRANYQSRRVNEIARLISGGYLRADEYPDYANELVAEGLAEPTGQTYRVSQDVADPQMRGVLDRLIDRINTEIQAPQ